jgi:formylglycine-generating enzyme required for sulfatase activity
MRKILMLMLLSFGCGDDEPLHGRPDAAPAIDADPTAPDADPAAPDAPPGTPDARPAPDAPPGTPDAAPIIPPVSETVTIPAMTFTMGSDASLSPGARPAHPVTLTHAYEIDKNEVTTAEYRLCVAAGACTLPQKFDQIDYLPIAGGLDSATRPGYFNDPTYDNYPVIYVSKVQADAYCAWVGKRLPTEAEWELAARGPDKPPPATAAERDYPWGGASPNCFLANYYGYTACVGDTDTVTSRSPAGDSSFGARNMAGNVNEWVADYFDGDLYTACASGCTDPYVDTPPDGYIVLNGYRGGSWTMGCGTWGRPTVRVGATANDIGFRCAKTVP